MIRIQDNNFNSAKITINGPFKSINEDYAVNDSSDA